MPSSKSSWPARDANSFASSTKTTSTAQRARGPPRRGHRRREGCPRQRRDRSWQDPGRRPKPVSATGRGVIRGSWQLRLGALIALTSVLLGLARVHRPCGPRAHHGVEACAATGVPVRLATVSGCRVIVGGKTHAHIKHESALRSPAHRSGEMGHTPVRAPGRASVGRRLQCE